MTIHGDSRTVLLWGATGQARVLHEYLRRLGYEVVALLDNNEKLRESPIPGVPLIAGEGCFARWREAWTDRPLPRAIAAIGGARGRDRLEIQEFLAAHGLSPLTVIHPRAFVADDATIGEGSQVLAQSAVCADATLGRACIINTGATVDHECRIGDGVHVAPGAHLAGCVVVGDFAMIGIGAVVLPRIVIGAGVVVGGGAVVTSDIAANMTVVGNPARVVVRSHP